MRSRRVSTGEIVAGLQDSITGRCALKANQLAGMELVPIGKPLRKESLHL